MFFGCCIHDKGGQVLTLDINVLIGTSTRVPSLPSFDKPTQWFNLAKRFNVTFKQRNVFRETTVKEVEDFIKDKPTLIFCDDGNKKREFPLYSKILKRNDLIMTHDWGYEIKQEHLDSDTLAILEHYRQKDFDVSRTQILSMRRLQ